MLGEGLDGHAQADAQRSHLVPCPYGYRPHLVRGLPPLRWAPKAIAIAGCMVGASSGRWQRARKDGDIRSAGSVQVEDVAPPARSERFLAPRETQVQLPARESLFYVLVRETRVGSPPAERWHARHRRHRVAGKGRPRFHPRGGAPAVWLLQPGVSPSLLRR